MNLQTKNRIDSYTLLQGLTLVIIFSYFLVPYFPRYSFDFFGKAFFVSQILMGVSIALLLWAVIFSDRLRERLRLLMSLRHALLPLFAFGGIMVFSTLLTNGISSVGFSRLLSVVAIFLIFLLSSLLTRRYIDWFFAGSAMFTIIASLLGYLQFFVGSVFAPSLYLSGRSEIFAVGFAKHSSLFGLHLSVFLIIFWILWIYNYRDRQWLWGTTFLMGVPALVLTFSRGAWLGTGVVGFALFVWLVRRGVQVRKRTFVTTAVSIVLAILAFAASLYFSPDHMRSSAPSGADSSLAEINTKLVDQRLSVGDRSSMTRVQFHQAAFTLLLESPQNMLIGLGSWGFWENWPRLDPEVTIQKNIDPHSTFLEVLTGAGVIGFIFFALFWGHLFNFAFKYRDYSPLLLLLLATSVSILLNGLTHTHLYTKYTWIIAGILAAVLIEAQKKQFDPTK